MDIEYIDLDDYEVEVVAIDEIYDNITNALEDIGYMYYDSLHCKRPRFFKHMYKNNANYYIIKKVNYKHNFIFNIELANITELIMKLKGR